MKKKNYSVRLASFLSCRGLIAPFLMSIVAIISLSVFSISNANAQANAGIWDSYIKIGGKDYYLGTSGTIPSAFTTNQFNKPDFDGVNFGSFSSTATLDLEGGNCYNWKPTSGSAGNICGASLYYAVYPVGQTPGFTQLQLNDNGAQGNKGTGNAYFWQQYYDTTASVNILAGLSPGKYYIAVYINSTGSQTGNDCNSNITANGLPDTTAGAYYMATFTIKGLKCPPGPATGANLFTNGDFSAGNTGFTTAYTYIATGAGNSYPNQYFIGDAAQVKTFNSTFVTNGTPSGGNGNFMAVDGSSTKGLKVWSETVNVTTNTTYIFSFYICSFGGSSPAQLYFYANNAPFGGSANAPTVGNEWTKVIESWCSGSNTSVTINIVDSNSVMIGNDFGLDSISLRSGTSYSNISAGNDTTVCGGNSVMLNPTPGACAYAWSSTAGGSLSNDTIQTPLASPTTTSTYTLQAIVPGCTNDTLTSQVVITVGGSLSISAGSPASICAGNNTTLDGSGATTYSWSPSNSLSSSTISNPVATPTATTTYTLTASSGGGCTGSATVVVTVGTALNGVSAGSPVSICSGVGDTLHGIGGTTFSWSPATGLSSSTISNPVASPTATTTYTLTSTNGSGCSGQATVVVTVGSFNPPITPGDTTLCSGHSVQLNIKGAGLTVSWTPTTGLSNPNIPNPVATPTLTTTYTASISNTSGCTATASAIINVNASSVSGNVSSASDTICPGTIADLSVKGNSAGVQWQSSPDSSTGFTNISGATSGAYTSTPLNKTTYFRVVAGSGDCADTSRAFKITIIPPPTTSFGASANGKVVTFTVNGNVGVISYYWDFGDGNNSNLQNPTHTYDSVKTYDVCLTVRNNSNCNFTTCQNVTTYPTGINEIPNSNAWLVYPDPFSAQLYISTGSSTVKAEKVELFDVLGRKVFSSDEVTENPIKLDLTNLVAGAYFIRITSSQGEFIKKIVKE